MGILSATFGSDAAAEIWVGALVFLLMYLTGFVLFQKWPRISMPTPVVHRHIISGLSAALAAVGVVFWLYAANGATASAKGAQNGSAIAPQEPHGAAMTGSMPVLRFEDQSVIYPGRN
jgi:cytochrome b subunit of formate dehydrogenase